MRLEPSISRGKRALFTVLPVAVGLFFFLGLAFKPQTDSEEAGRCGTKPRPRAERGILVAAVQFASTLGDVEGNRKALLRLTREAGEAGARVVVLPETAIQGYMTADGSMKWCTPDFPSDEEETSLEGYAETVPGSSTKAFATLARELAIYVLVPLVEHETSTNRYFNSAVLVGPSGEVAAHYRKAHPWTVAEYGWASEGDGKPVVVKTPLGPVGILICYDIHGMLPKLAEAGAKLVLTPIWWVDSHPELWFLERLPDRCRQYGVALVAANRAATGMKGERPGAGFSCVISSTGKILDMAGAEEGITVARVPMHSSR
jgi:predicted amidohydrolase